MRCGLPTRQSARARKQTAFRVWLAHRGKSGECGLSVVEPAALPIAGLRGRLCLVSVPAFGQVPSAAYCSVVKIERCEAGLVAQRSAHGVRAHQPAGRTEFRRDRAHARRIEQLALWEIARPGHHPFAQTTSQGEANITRTQENVSFPASREFEDKLARRVLGYLGAANFAGVQGLT